MWEGSVKENTGKDEQEQNGLLRSHWIGLTSDLIR
jgi:hypothetical protein